MEGKRLKTFIILHYKIFIKKAASYLTVSLEMSAS